MREQIVAQIEFDFAGDADQDPAGQVLEDGLDRGDRKQQQRILQHIVANHRRAVVPGDADVQNIDGLANDEREENPDAVVA